MQHYIYDIALCHFLDAQGTVKYDFQPVLVFGQKPEWHIALKSNRQPVDLSGIMSWSSAVAEDFNPGTRPLCRTTSGIAVVDGDVVVPINTQTDTFCGATAKRCARTCVFELSGFDANGDVSLYVSFQIVCKITADPGAAGNLTPIETTDMTSSQVQAMARGAAREEVAEIQEEIEQARETAANAAETASGAASSALASAEAAMQAAATVPSPEGASPGDVPTVQEDGSVAYQPQQGGATVDSELSDTSENAVQNKVITGGLNGINAKIPQAATAQNQLADKEFVNSSINNMAAFYIVKDTAGNPFGTKAELNAATQYYSGGAIRVPTKNDYTVVLHDESKGTIYAGYADFSATDDYIGCWVVSGEDNAAFLVDSANKDAIGIVPGTTAAYVVLPSTRYLYDNQWQYQYVFNNSGLTAAQWASLNSGIDASRVALIGTAIQSSEKNAANGVAGLDGNGQVPMTSISPYYNVETITASTLTLVPGHSYIWNPADTTSLRVELASGVDAAKAFKCEFFVNFALRKTPTFSGIDVPANTWDSYSSRLKHYAVLGDGTDVRLRRVIYGDVKADDGNTTGAVAANSNSGWTVNSSGVLRAYNNNGAVDSRSSGWPLSLSFIDYAVRSVSPNITTLPADAASPIALTDASATTRNHSWTYTHAPDSAPTYTLPAVSDSTITHEIVLYLDMASTATFAFQDSEGTTIAIDTNGVTPAIGETWVVWAEFSALKSKWIVRAMKETNAEVQA